MIEDIFTHQSRWVIRRYASDEDYREGVPTPVIDATGKMLPAVSKIEGNVLLEEGIQELWDRVCSLGSPTAFDNSNAQLGVGDGEPSSLTGTVTFSNGSATVTGSGTSFSSEVTAGDFIKLDADGLYVEVQSVDSNTQITLTANYSGTGGAGAASVVVRPLATQTDLLATTNVAWKDMETGFPSRSSQTVTWRSVFGTSDANYKWVEFSVRNGATADKNLNRKVYDQGTKASGQTWTLDLAITLS